MRRTLLPTLLAATFLAAGAAPPDKPFELNGDGRLGLVGDRKPGQPLRPAFFALDRPVKGSVPVLSTRPLFHGLPADANEPPATTVPLYEFVHKDGQRRAYSVEATWSRPGYERAKQPVCLVWRNPVQVVLPRE